MANSLKYASVIFGLLLMTGCVSPPAPLSTNSPPVEDRDVYDDDVRALPSDRELSTKPLRSQQRVSPVVQRLLVSANTQINIGNADAAANALERALRIEPRNALLWSRLAAINFNQKKWQQAIQFASKSNTLASKDQALRQENWLMIGDAYDALGDHEKAAKARNKSQSSFY